MEADVDPNADPALSPRTPPPRKGRSGPGPIAGAAWSWSLLVGAVNLVRVLLVTGDWIDPRWLGPGLLGPGEVATVGGLLAAVGLVASWKRPLVGGGAFVWLGLAHAVAMVVFPPRPLIDAVMDERTVCYAGAQDPVYALTIDDGLDPDATPQILDVLRRHDARATFFVLGESLEAYPDLADRCLREGHELANHQMRDVRAGELGDQLPGRIDAAHALLVAAAERSSDPDANAPRWYRPGGGFTPENAFPAAERHGYRVVLGSVFPFDPFFRSARFLRVYLAGRVGPGEIVVLHDGSGRGERTAAALDWALPRLN
ncbi:MAG: polysaccharide deacetylase family protein, partial [Planctomycetota bacterium]